MVTRLTTDTIPEYYDEGSLPWPWPEDEVPERIPIEPVQSPAIKHLLMLLSYHYLELGLTPFIDTNFPLRFNPNNRRVFIAPDILVSFDVDLTLFLDKNSYDLWEVGKPPEFALEVASVSTHRKDLYEKPDIYAYLGVDEYWMFDPKGGELYEQTLAGYRLVDGRYEPIEIALNEHGLESGYSEALGLRLCWIERSRQSELVAVQPDFVFMPDDFTNFQLLLQDADTGLYVLNPHGVGRQRASAEADRQCAEADRQRAESELHAERERAELAEAEVARLREEFRRMMGQS